MLSRFTLVMLKVLALVSARANVASTPSLPQILLLREPPGAKSANFGQVRPGSISIRKRRASALAEPCFWEASA